MRLPYSWLREAVSAGAPGWDVAPEELERTLLAIGHEVEGVVPLGPVTGPLTIGRVTEIAELSEFKKPIRACRVDVGGPVDREIICGATNFAVGALVVVALPGTTLLYRLFHGERARVFTRRPLAARCRCSRQRIDRVLRSIKRQELDDLRDASGRVLVKCEFCSTEYAYDDGDLDRIYASAA